MKPNRIAVLIVIILVLGTAPVFSQERNVRSLPEIRIVPVDSTDSPDDDRIATARRLMSHGAYMSAADYLEPLYSEDRSSRKVIDLLITCYLELKAFPRAEAMLQAYLDSHPDEFQYRTRLFEIALKNGNDSLVDATLQDMQQKFADNSSAFRPLIQLLKAHRYTDRAMDLITQNREHFNDNKLFILEAASVYEMQREYKKAVREYLRLTDADSVSIRRAERHLASLIRYPGAVNEVVEVLEVYLDSVPENSFGLKVILEAYSRNNQYEKAFGAAIRLDSLTGGSGQELFLYMMRCHERKLFQQVIEIAEYLERIYIDTTPAMHYKFLYADALVGLGHYDSAMTLYTDLANNDISKRNRLEALLNIGNLYRYYFLNYDSAAYYYRQIAGTYRGMISIQALFELAELYLVRGELQAAGEAFKSLKTKKLTELQGETADFKLAMISFLGQDYPGAEMLFRKHIESYPRGFYVNDALMFSLIIGENVMSSPDALRAYADMEFFKVRLMPDSVENRLISIWKMPYSALTGLTGWKLAQFYSELSDTAQAFDIISDMETNHVDDYYYPYCLKLKGDICYLSELLERAGEIYRMILEDYGTYPFIGEVRDRLQVLEKGQIPG